jgi:hypothetical protein
MGFRLRLCAGFARAKTWTEPAKAKTELLLAHADRERAEAEKARAQAAYWRVRARHDEAGDAGSSGPSDERVEREARREELEIESLELGNWLKLAALFAVVGGATCQVIVVMLGLGHPGFLPHELLRHFGWLPKV